MSASPARTEPKRLEEIRADPFGYLANCIDYERKAEHFPEMRRMMIEEAEREAALRAAVRKNHPHIDGDAK